MRVIVGMILALGVLISGACASFNTDTKMTTMRDPAWNGTAPPQRIMVLMSHHDLKVRGTTESAFEKAAEGTSTTFVPASRLFFPGRDYDADEIHATLDEHGIAGILSIDSGDVKVSNPFRSINTSCKSTGNNVNCQSMQGGGIYDMRHATYRMRLFHQDHDSAVWMADIENISNVFVSANGRREVLAKRTLKQLAEDGLIGSKGGR